MLSPAYSKDSTVSANTDKEKMYFKIFSDTSPNNLQANALQRKLNSYYKRLMHEPKNFLDIPDDLQEIADVRAMENAWNKHLDAGINHSFPKSKNEFRSWYLSINQDYKTAVKPFFNYFSKKASLEELALYLIFEQQIDGSFDDTVALGQLGLKGKAKMVLAENYWDEMGNGIDRDVHTTMFADSVDYLKPILKKARPDIDVAAVIPTAALANGNMLFMYANRRKFIPRMLGAIGILEDTAPDRFKATVSLMKKYNLPEQVLRYHVVHVCCDHRHGEDILDHVLVPTVMAGDDALLHEICKGVMIRLNVAIEYYKSLELTFASLFKTGV